MKWDLSMRAKQWPLTTQHIKTNVDVQRLEKELSMMIFLYFLGGTWSSHWSQSWLCWWVLCDYLDLLPPMMMMIIMHTCPEFSWISLKPGRIRRPKSTPSMKYYEETVMIILIMIFIPFSAYVGNLLWGLCSLDP